MGKVKWLLSGLCYFGLSVLLAECFAGGGGLGFWAWAALLGIVMPLIITVLSVRFFSLKSGETVFAAFVGSVAICVWGATRGWFLFANRREIIEISLTAIVCAISSALIGSRFAGPLVRHEEDIHV